MDGFEEFRLLRPTDGRTTWLVYIRWRDEDAFQAWVGSQSFSRGHAQPQGAGGPVVTHSARWEFGLAQEAASRP